MSSTWEPQNEKQLPPCQSGPCIYMYSTALVMPYRRSSLGSFENSVSSYACRLRCFEQVLNWCRAVRMQSHPPHFTTVRRFLSWDPKRPHDRWLIVGLDTGIGRPRRVDGRVEFLRDKMA
eukprot:5933844-Pyramimonas_sp.AAC.1